MSSINRYLEISGSASNKRKTAARNLWIDEKLIRGHPAAMSNNLGNYHKLNPIVSLSIGQTC
jgi:hypothetical protein